jgi:hypothetical protein
LLSGGDTLISESLRRESDRLRDELTGDEASAVVRLLADQVVAAGLELR